jgi:hypothetical protein
MKPRPNLSQDDEQRRLAVLMQTGNAQCRDGYAPQAAADA